MPSLNSVEEIAHHLVVGCGVAPAQREHNNAARAVRRKFYRTSASSLPRIL